MILYLEKLHLLPIVQKTIKSIILQLLVVTSIIYLIISKAIDLF